MNDDFTTTPNYSLYKPVPNADYDLWGDHLNANADTLDALIRKLDARGSSGNLLLVTSFLPAGQPDGITDNAAGIQAAIDAAAGMTPDIDRAAAPGFARLLIQAASAPYIIGTGLLIPSNSHLVVEQGATLKIADAANCSMLLIVPGASNIAIDLYGALDGNASQQTFGSATVDLFDFERDGGGSASGGVCSLGRCSDIQVDGFRQGTITNFYHWGVNIVCATNAEVRDVSVTKCGASTEFAGLSTRVNITGGSYTTATGAMTITTGTPHGINVGDTFTYVAASGPAAQVQGEYVALTVADALTVTCQAAANLVGGNPALTDGRVGTCTKCYNAGFVGCVIDNVDDLGLCLYGGVVGGYIRGCEVRNCISAGPSILSDAAQPGACSDCEISGCYSHDNISGGIAVTSNQFGIIQKNTKVFGNTASGNLRGGIAVGACDGIEISDNLVHNNRPQLEGATMQSGQIVVGSAATRVNIRDNTIRDSGPSSTAQTLTSLLSLAYNPTTGGVSCTTSVAHNAAIGSQFHLSNLDGTGAFAALNGWWTAAAGTGGTTLNFTAPTGLTLTVTDGRVLAFTLAVALSHIVANTYTADSSGNISLTTDAAHGLVAANSFVLSSMAGSVAAVNLNGLHVATTGTTGTTLNFVALPSTSAVVTGGRVLPANLGISTNSPDYCRIAGNRIADYQHPAMMTAALGGAWGQAGVSEGNYYGPRNAIAPDVSVYGNGSVQANSQDALFGVSVVNGNIAGAVTFQGATQQSGATQAYFQSRGLTPGWNYNSGRGEVDFFCGQSTGSPGGFDFLQVAVLKITAGTYDPVTGAVVLTTALAHGLVPGSAFGLSGLSTSTGDDLVRLTGAHTATTGTSGTTINFTDSIGLTIASFSIGVVTPSGAGGGLVNLGVGIFGSLLANDGLGNTRLGGALVHGAMQTATLANAGTVTVNPNTSLVLVQNASSIATGAVVLPAPAGSYQLDGSILEVRFQNPVGTLTMTAATGAGVAGPPTTVLSAGANFRFILSEPGNVWLPCLPDVSGTPPVGGPYLPLSGGGVTGATTFAALTTHAAGLTVSGGTTTTQQINVGSGSSINFLGATQGFTNAGNGTVFEVKNIGATGLAGHIQIGGNSTGNAPQINAIGSDTNIGIAYNTKGTGIHAFNAPLNARAYTQNATFALSGTQTANQQGLNSLLTLSGSVSSGTLNGNYLAVLDTTDSSATTDGATRGLRVDHNLNAGFKGSRYGFHTQLTVAGTSANTIVSGQYCGGFVNATASVNDNGTSPDTAGAKGGLTGFNPMCVLGAGATNWAYQTGLEIDVQTIAGASVYNKSGLLIVLQLGHAVQATGSDAAIAIGSQIGATAGWKSLFSFGSSNGPQPFPLSASNGNVMDVAVGQNISSSLLGTQFTVPAALNGINLEWLEPSRNAFASANFRVDGTGAVRVGAGRISHAAGTLSVDAADKYVSSAVVVSGGGANNLVGDRLYGTDGYGDTYRVTAVGGGGAVTTVAVLNAGSASGTPPANVTTIGGSGGAQAVVIGRTWTAAATLALQPSGGAIQAGSGAWTANGSTSVSLTALAPAGAHATVQEWLTIKDASGTVRYVPCF